MENHVKPIYNPEFKCAAKTSCSLCGKRSNQQFKHGFVCEDCLIYVKRKI